MPPRTSPKAPRTRLPPDARRAQLLACALASFAEHGIARATQSVVATRAGVSVSAVYSYFPTREDLVDAVLEDVERRLVALCAEGLVAAGPVQQVLAALATGFARLTHSDPDLIIVWLDWSTSVGSPLFARYAAASDRVLGLMRPVLRRGIETGEVPAGQDIDAAAQALLNSAYALTLLRFSGRAEAEIDAYIRVAVRGVMGLAAPTS